MSTEMQILNAFAFPEQKTIFVLNTYSPGVKNSQVPYCQLF